MNKSFITKNLLNRLARKLSGMRVLGIVVMTTMMTQSLIADCGFTMACNDGIQVSLTGNCEAVITPSTMLENMYGVEADYTVTVMYADGTVVPNATVTFAEAGQTLSVNVEHTLCQLSCWGNITVEDKLPPTYINCNAVGVNPLEVECNSSLLPTTVTGGVLPVPQATDACSGITYTYIDDMITMNCTSAYVSQLIRTWTATDVGGNSTTCVQTINILKADIEDVDFPANYTENLNQTGLGVCHTVLDTLANGAPTPEELGSPTNTSCGNLQVHYNDTVIPLCGKGKKYLRTWTVIDWCTGVFSKQVQVIKLEDVSPPVIQCGTTLFNVEILSEDCAASFSVPHPDDENIVITECSGWKYKITYSIAQQLPDGSCPTDFVGTFIDDEVVFNNDGTRDSDGYTSNGTFTINNLPQGCAWIKYSIIDDCGHETFCTKDVQIVDGTMPSPACEAFTVIALDSNGWAEMMAETLDDGSWDNCGIDRFEIRRVDSFCDDATDLTFGPNIHFCCEDIMNNPIKVQLGVYDLAGNFNFCTVNVTVQETVAPVLTCPSSSLSITCAQDPDNLTITGQPTYTSLCGNTYPFSYTDVELYNDCGVGSITRTWTLDAGPDAGVVCVQNINITNNDPLTTGDVIFPGTRTVIGCTVADATPEILNSFPTVNNTGCTNIAVSYNDVVQTINPNYCIQILRTWRVIDWCTFNAGAPVFVEKVQTININNNQAPTFTSNCSSVDYDAAPGSCDAYVTLLAMATDDCTPSNQIYYHWEVDANSNGTVDLSGNGNNASGTYPSGIHKVTFFATDACGNEAMCMYNFTVGDNKPPTPICLADVTWVIDENGIAEIWALDFDFKSEDTCTPQDELVFSFNAAGTQQVISFTCADIPNGIATTIQLDMYVIDSDGNYDFCTVNLHLQDSKLTNACADAIEASAKIAGRIFSPDSVALELAEVQLADMIVNSMTMDMTSEDGSYAFNDVKFYDSYVVAPVKNDDPLNGVSTLDLALIQKHILGISNLDTPYKLIAGDINGSNSVTAIDLIELRKMILGVVETFPSNTSWRFMPTTHEIEFPTSPWGFPETVSIESLYLSDEDIDFIAIKVGDVNKTAVLGLNSPETVSNRSVDALRLTSHEEYGETVISLAADSATDLIGLQFALSIDPSSTILGVESAAAKVSQNDYRIVGNTVLVSWTDAHGLELKRDEVLLQIRLSNANTIASLDNNILKAEAYTNSLEVLDIKVENRSNTLAVDDILLRNSPNPFVHATELSFNIIENTSGTISIFDANGKLVRTQVSSFVQGLNTVNILSADLAGAGLYVVKLDTGKQTAVSKMIVLQ